MYARCHDSYFRLTHRQWIILNSEFIFMFNDWLIQTFFKVRSDCRVIWSYHRFMSSRSHVRCRNICAINNFQKTLYFLPQTIGSRRFYDVENPIQNNSNWTMLPNYSIYYFCDRTNAVIFHAIIIWFNVGEFILISSKPKNSNFVSQSEIHKLFWFNFIHVISSTNSRTKPILSNS